MNQGDIMSQSMYVRRKEDKHDFDVDTTNVLQEFMTVQKLPPSQNELLSFMSTISVQFCITSPSTRLSFESTKEVKGRETLVMNNKKIWLENQGDCVHSMFQTSSLRVLMNCQSSKINRQELLTAFHCENIHGFVQIFCSLPEVRDSIFRMNNHEQIQDKYGINVAFTELLNALQEYIKDSPQYKNIYNKDLQDDIERQLTSLIFNKMYPKDPSARDIELNMRIKTLEWITDDNLEIKPEFRMEHLWQDAANILNTIDNQKNGLDKLNVLIKFTQIITDALKQASSADVVFPLVIKILLIAKPSRLQSNINFVELFTNKSRMLSEAGYCFTQMKSAMMWLENVTNQQLKIDKQDFQRRIYEKELKYNLVKQRPRRERVLIK
ncbi:hypothetical protein pb186bvf_015645 [Paramecium bursaria]